MPRPKFDPTEEQRVLVKTLAAVGISHELIARKLGIRSEKTLRKYFRNELDLGLMEANANVGSAVYQKAKAGNVEAAKVWNIYYRGGERKQWTLKNAHASPPPFVVACDEKIGSEQVVSIDTEAETEDDFEKGKEAA